MINLFGKLLDRTLIDINESGVDYSYSGNTWFTSLKDNHLKKWGKVAKWMISKKEFGDNSLFFEACEKKFLKQM